MFNKIQKREIQRFLDRAERGHSSANLMNVFSAVAYLVKTGCQWSKIPPLFAVVPTTAYYHFRAWSEDDHFMPFLRSLVLEKRHKNGQIPQPVVAVIDSQSVRSALQQSQKGVDGNKRDKRIKRQYWEVAGVPTATLPKSPQRPDASTKKKPHECLRRDAAGFPVILT